MEPINRSKLRYLNDLLLPGVGTDATDLAFGAVALVRGREQQHALWPQHHVIGPRCEAGLPERREREGAEPGAAAVDGIVEEGSGAWAEPCPSAQQCEVRVLQRHVACQVVSGFLM